MGVSVIICCYNSEKRLPRTLEALSKQETNVEWEVIIVDNNSSDNTAKIAKEIWESLGVDVPLNISFEKNSGLTFARIHGVKISSYNLIVFCDDDNHLKSNYLQIVNDFFQHNDDVGITGGYGQPISDIEFPDWFTSYSHMYACGPQNRLNDEPIYVYGAGMGIRKELFFKCLDNFNSLLSDRTKDNLISGGDTEICLQSVILGYKVKFLQDLKFDHYIPSTRLSKKYILKLAFWMGFSSGFLRPYIYCINDDKKSIERSNIWLKDILYTVYYFFRQKFSLIILYNKMGFCLSLIRQRNQYDLTAKKLFEKKYGLFSFYNNARF